MLSDNELINKAFLFASEKHQGQTYNDGEYIQHPLLTYEILTKISPEDINLRTAGLLHDLSEDQGVTKETLQKEFNEDVADLVIQVSKDENKNFPITSYRGLILKVADRLANVSNYQTLPPERRAKLFNKYANGFVYEGSNLKVRNIVTEKIK